MRLIEDFAPLDLQEVIVSVKKTGRILVVEEVAETGCIGKEILAGLMACGVTASSKLLNLGTGIVPHGDVRSLQRETGIDPEAIYSAAKELLKHEA